MKEKARKLIYLNSGNYISYSFLKRFYWCVIILPFFTIVMGVYLLNLNGVNSKSLFPLLSISIWTSIYWTLVLTIKSNFVKKSFDLRFLVNGIFGILVSSLIWIFFASWNLMADKPFLDFDVFLWMVPIYMLVSMLYVLGIIIGVHYGVYAKIKMKSKATVFLSTSISLVVGMGMIVSRVLREAASLKLQHIILTVCVIILIFVPVLAHVNFVQYFYCKKYNINCDEDGCTASLDLSPTDKDPRKGKDPQDSKSKYKSFLKILLISIGLPLAIFAVFCIISLIKGFMKGIS